MTEEYVQSIHRNITWFDLYSLGNCYILPVFL